jgi:F-type H+-transporting ATPase subunit epsilon
MTQQTNRLRCVILTPDALVAEIRVDSVVLPCDDGMVGILPGHAPFLSILASGPMRTRDADDVQQVFFLDGGVVHVRNNKLTILTRSVRTSD